MKKTILIACLLVTIACAGHQASPVVPDSAGAFPDDYEMQIRNWFNQNAIDPGSIKLVSIGRPFLWTAERNYISGLEKNSEYYKCRVIVNGKNRAGGYTGNQKKDFFFKYGRLDTLGYGYTDWADD